MKKVPKDLKEMVHVRHEAYTSNASTSNAGDRVQHLMEQIERKSKKMNSKSQISIRNATKNSKFKKNQSLTEDSDLRYFDESLKKRQAY